MARVFVHPWKQGSRSARALAKGLGGKVLRRQGSQYRHRPGDVLINWGDSTGGPKGCLNDPMKLKDATNKKLAFNIMKNKGVSIPAFAVTAADVSWKGLTVVRHKLTGHSGEGIEIVEPGKDLPSAPLYVEYIKKQDEFRIHIIGETVIAVQRKARDLDNPNPNWKVRNHANGFIFVRQGVNAPTSVLEEAKRAISALGLDFGAVDVIWNVQQRKAYVLEVNTAPGLEGQTVEDYVNGFRDFIRQRG